MSPRLQPSFNHPLENSYPDKKCSEAITFSKFVGRYIEHEYWRIFFIVYVPVNATQGANSITLSFNLADRTGGTNTANLVTPTWRIKVTQLECGSSAYDYSTLASTLSALGQQHLHKSLLASSDYYWLGEIIL